MTAQIITFISKSVVGRIHCMLHDYSYDDIVGIIANEIHVERDIVMINNQPIDIQRVEFRETLINKLSEKYHVILDTIIHDIGVVLTSIEQSPTQMVVGS